MDMTPGAQLYTLRMYTQTPEDLDDTLAQVAQMGYGTVQISAIGPMPPEVVRDLCDKHGLKIVLTHTDPVRILKDTEAVIKEHDILGCRYIGIGMMPEKYRHPEWFPHFIKDYKEPARKIAASGKLLMYHNHNLEFQRFDGRLVMESLLSAFTPEEMGFTLDTYWVQMGGADVCQWLRRLKGRIPCVHLKDMAVEGMQPVMAPVGEGNLPWKEILGVLREQGGTEHLLVEQDICQGSPFDCLNTSLQNLRALGL